jgi:hypothetical protein
VYWTISEKRKAKADAETSAFRVLLRGRSYMFGRFAAGFVPVVVCWDGAEGREKRDVVVGERWSTEDWEELETTERRGCG